MLATSRALLTPLLGDQPAYSPQTLFLNGEQGGIYDPADLTAEKLAWVAANPGFTSAQFLAAFPNHTLFQDSAGTTPVTALGQPVGRVLDTSGRGNHAIQATSASRPLLDARVNLLTFSEQFDNAAWTKGNLSVTANTAVAPDGTTTADKIVENTAFGTHYVYQTPTYAATTYQFSAYLKAAERTWAKLNVFRGVDYTAYVNLSTGAVGSTAGGATLTTANVGNGWWLCVMTFTVATAGSSDTGIRTATGNSVDSYTGDGTSGILVWGADLRLATDAAYPYQRVAAATDYADVGVPRSFLFDGVDDSLYTASNMDLSGTDKVTVLAGVRKLSDAAAGVVLGHGADFTASASWEFQSNTGANPTTAFRGVSSSGAINTAGFTRDVASPATFVFAALVNYGAAAGSEFSGRYNGVTQAQNVGLTENNTGNFGNRVLTIASRQGGTTQRFNGKAYQLIVRGAATAAGPLAQAELYVAGRTGIYL